MQNSAIRSRRSGTEVMINKMVDFQLLTDVAVAEYFLAEDIALVHMSNINSFRGYFVAIL